MGKFSVLHGFRPSAGQPALLAQEMRRQGVEARSVIIGRNDFRYEFDDQIAPSQAHEYLGQEASHFDVVHIHAIPPFFNRHRLRFPMGTDLLALKAAGKRIVVQFRGSEVRAPSKFAAKNPFHYVDENPNGVFDSFSAEFQRDYISMCESIADIVLVGDPELQDYLPQSRILPRAINLEKLKRAPVDNRRPLIVHAPSSPIIKGTKYVVAAVENLKKEGLAFDFELVEGLSHHEAMQIYRRADIIVDQLRIGWYGVLAVEGMALGKTVVSYIREDLVSHFKGQMPLANANPLSIEAVLRQLVRDRALRLELAERGYQHCRRVHDVRSVVSDALDIYTGLLSSPARFELSSYMDVNLRQTLALDADTRPSVKAIAALDSGLRYWRKYGALKFAKRLGQKAARKYR